jgi:hypothetical protein
MSNLPRLERYYATGAAAISKSFPNSDTPCVVRGIRLHFDAASTTSENFTITLNDKTGAAYDTVLYSLDLSVSSVVDLYYAEPVYLEAGDYIDIAYANTDTNTYGLTILAEIY